MNYFDRQFVCSRSKTENHAIHSVYRYYRLIDRILRVDILLLAL